MLISAVICTHNRATYLVKALKSLVEQSLPAAEYEIVVVDNASTDATKAVVEQWAEQANIRYTYEPTLGLSYARNRGWQLAQAKYVAYLDDDGIACPNWLEKIVEVFETVIPCPGCVGGKAEAIWEADRPQWISDQLVTCLTVIDWSDTPQTIPDLSQKWLVGANFAFPRKVLEEIGGFVSGLDRVGKNLLSGGDIFLEKQILKAGYSCFYHPDIAIGHHIQKSRLEQQWFIRRYYWQGMSDAMAQSIEESLSGQQRIRAALWRLVGLLRSPKKLVYLLLPGAKPAQFTEKCFTLIELGHIVGLLSLPASDASPS